MKSNLAVELPDSDSDSTTSSVAASGFVAFDTAGCGPLPSKCNGGNPIGGLGGLVLMAEQSEGWVFDTSASEKMTNFRPCNSKIGMVESKYAVQIEGRGDLVVNFKSSPSGTVRMNL